MIDKKNIDFLLGEYFRGELDAKSTAQLEQWISESEENRFLAKDTYKIESLSSQMKFEKQANSEAALRAIRVKLRKKRMASTIHSFYRVAAMLLLPLVLALSFYAYEYYRVEDSEMVEIKTITGAVSSLELPDGSKVWLNSNSSLKYPVKFGKIREVALVGEAYFDIAKVRGKKFIVNASNVQIEVLGTEFNVEAYPEEEQSVKTTLIEGEVQLKYEKASGEFGLMKMKPGQEAVYCSENKDLQLSEVKTIYASSWREGKIVLENTPLSDALRMIEKRYNVKFFIKNPKLLNNTYTGTFTNQRLEVILDIFRKTTDINFDFNISSTEENKTISGRQVIVVH